MIVKDEASVIERCLDSVRALIDHWVICDTGSTDGTQEVIRAALDDVPGELHQRPWVDFGHNRTELMERARGAADYLLLIDADMTVTFDRGRLAGLTADSYMLRHVEDPEYWIKRLVRGDRAWRYIGPTHEYITADGPDRTERLDAIAIHHHADGGARADKLDRDLLLLSREHDRNPGDPRTVFYLAQTLRDLWRLEQAVDFYERRAGMEGWEEEKFYSLYQVGSLSRGLGRRARAIEALLAAWSLAPHRAEPLCVLAALFRERGEYHAAHLVTEQGLDIDKPRDGLFVERWVYEWGLLFEYSIAAYWVGKPQAALDACDRLLSLPQLPDAHRRQTLENRAYCVQAAPTQPAATSSVPYRWQRPGRRTSSTGIGGTSPPNVTVVEGGHRLLHRGTVADRAMIRKVFGKRAYALEALARWPALGIGKDGAGLSGRPLIVDLGAHIGAASVWFALRYPGAQVIALEPDPGNFPLLQANAAAHPQITALQAAITARPGRRPLVDSQTGRGVMGASSERSAGAEQVVGEVDAVTIDQLLEGAGAGAEPFILRADIEGAEDELFSTHWPSLARFALVIMELHDRLLPGAGTSRSFLRWHVAQGRDLVPLGESLFSLIPG